MPWCLPQPHFPKGSKRKLKISNPLSPEEVMRRGLHPDAGRESGALYLVQNKLGQGKTVVRRPHPPATSVPLDDNFDAITQGGTTTKGARTEWGTLLRRSIGGRTTSPTRDDFDANTFTANTRKGGSEWASTQSKGRIRTLLADRNRGSPQNNMMWNNRAEVQDERSMKQERSALARNLTVKSRDANAQESPDDIGPRAGQDYEVVSRHVVEDGPERTVTIATWREQVAREATHDIDSMSVYYLGPDDYIENGHSSGTAAELNSIVKGSGRALPGMDQFQNQSTLSRSNMVEGTQTHSIRRTSQEQRRTHQRKMSAGRSDTIKDRPNMSREADNTGQPYWNYTPPRTATPERSPIRRGDTLLYSDRQEMMHRTPPYVPPRSSTPESRRTSPSPPRGLLTPPQELTSISRPVAQSSSRSGSTGPRNIPTSIAIFENILDSCVPSLLHIAPFLARLGITKKEHLQAIKRLSDETRDKEVKEEALRAGVTVMEWAILLDRIQTL